MGQKSERNMGQIPRVDFAQVWYNRYMSARTRGRLQKNTVSFGKGQKYAISWKTASIYRILEFVRITLFPGRYPQYSIFWLSILYRILEFVERPYDSRKTDGTFSP